MNHLGAGPEQEGPHGGRGAEADGGDVARHVLHRVVDGHPRRHGPSRRVDVQRDVLSRERRDFYYIRS